MKTNTGFIKAISGNMILVECSNAIMQNELAYVLQDQERLKAEVIKIKGNEAYLQVFEDTKGLRVKDNVEFSGTMLSVQLGPGLLGMIYDGLQNPLKKFAKKYGFFLPRGASAPALDEKRKWHFTPLAAAGAAVTAGSPLGWVQEGMFKHPIMVPFNFSDSYTVQEIAAKGDYKVSDRIAKIKDRGGREFQVNMSFSWPVKLPITAYKQKKTPHELLNTRVRIVDTFFPVAKGGTYCIPGPFGAGKTVLQQLISRYATVDVVIIAACGERAGEIVETIRKFPELTDPRTGKALMERTIIVCNTSSMPVAAREASVYTATTMGEYYRQMGLDVLLLADSTSRWAQAMREVSGRLEEIPGEEAFPAYLESRIAEFYERAGTVELLDGSQGSLTIGGTVSPAGGNFEEPVTQATLKVVGAFHGLSRPRADARKFPSIDPLESWSRYRSGVDAAAVAYAREVIRKGNEVSQMMKVVGEEGTALEDFIVYLKADFLDSVYLQQNGFDAVDANTNLDRQKYVFKKLERILRAAFQFEDKDKARQFFYELRQMCVDWNYLAQDTQEFKKQEERISAFLKAHVAVDLSSPKT